MALHLITGYAGEAHITSADQGAYNMATYGGGEFVLDRGNKFVTTLVSNNSITIADGEAMMQGRYLRMTPGTSEAVTIDNGSSGMKRNDLICLRYEKDPSTGIESVGFSVVKGEESSTTPVDPTYTHGDITDGDDLVNEMPLYRVYLNGLNVETITPLFSVYVSMKDYMEEYQLPTASSSEKGGIKVGSSFEMSGETLNLKGASASTLGGVKVDALPSGTPYVYGGIYSNNGVLRLVSATSDRLGITKTGKGLTVVSGRTNINLEKTGVFAYATREITVSARSFARAYFGISKNSYGNTYKKFNNSLAIPISAEATSGLDCYVLSLNDYSIDTNYIIIDVWLMNLSDYSVTITQSDAIRVFIIAFQSDYYEY